MRRNKDILIIGGVEFTGNRVNIGSDFKNRTGDIVIYLSDNSKVTRDLGWQIKKKSSEILEDIYLWIKNNEKVIKGNFL